MNLVEIINTHVGHRSGNHFIVCDDHLDELKATHTPDHFNVREIHKGFKSECQMCIASTCTPLDIEDELESYDVQVGFSNGEWEQGWSASGRGGKITYLISADGDEIFNNEESLARRGITEVYVEAAYRLHIDEEDE